MLSLPLENRPYRRLKSPVVNRFREARCLESRRRLTPGFTLIEIMIVLGIMAIMMSIGIPSLFRAMQKDPLRQGVSDVVEACHQARDMAILQGVPMEFCVVADGGGLSVRRAPQSTSPLAIPAAASDAPGLVASDEAPKPSSGSLFSAHLNRDVAVELIDLNLRDQMKQAETRVRFYPNGMADEFTIVLGWQQQHRRIDVDPLTGLTSVEPLQ